MIYDDRPARISDGSKRNASSDPRQDGFPCSSYHSPLARVINTIEESLTYARTPEPFVTSFLPFYKSGIGEEPSTGAFLRPIGECLVSLRHLQRRKPTQHRCLQLLVKRYEFTASASSDKDDFSAELTFLLLLVHPFEQCAAVKVRWSARVPQRMTIDWKTRC